MRLYNLCRTSRIMSISVYSSCLVCLHRKVFFNLNSNNRQFYIYFRSSSNCISQTTDEYVKTTNWSPNSPNLNV
jgi:hypothetical protein